MSLDDVALLLLRGGRVGGSGTLSLSGDLDFERNIDMLGSSAVRRSQLGFGFAWGTATEGSLGEGGMTSKGR
jgi:hypothetical protein